jgi:hypothetical protein
MPASGAAPEREDGVISHDRRSPDGRSTRCRCSAEEGLTPSSSPKRGRTASRRLNRRSSARPQRLSGDPGLPRKRVGPAPPGRPRGSLAALTVWLPDQRDGRQSRAPCLRGKGSSRHCGGYAAPYTSRRGRRSLVTATQPNSKHDPRPRRRASFMRFELTSLMPVISSNSSSSIEKRTPCVVRSPSWHPHRARRPRPPPRRRAPERVCTHHQNSFDWWFAELTAPTGRAACGSSSVVVRSVRVRQVSPRASGRCPQPLDSTDVLALSGRARR